ncbi:Putative toxin-antitoxin system, toxin component (fragment) [Desulfamplus magnetovallimortis]|uniref:Putative toxin-antitoxin system, toxin component n=1 Tax=Desulfamplus magnetovallimortis TaxID=1246637 RepID=A0A1W1HFK5_9BACT
MKYEWDENKNSKNRAKHKVDFNRVTDFEWDSAFEYMDDRQDYHEIRYCVLGYIGVRIFHLTYAY